MDRKKEKKAEPGTAKITFCGELVCLGPSFLVFNEDDTFPNGTNAYETLEGSLPGPEGQRLAERLHGSKVSVSIEPIEGE